MERYREYLQVILHALLSSIYFRTVASLGPISSLACKRSFGHHSRGSGPLAFCVIRNASQCLRAVHTNEPVMGMVTNMSAVKWVCKWVWIRVTSRLARNERRFPITLLEGFLIQKDSRNTRAACLICVQDYQTARDRRRDQVGSRGYGIILIVRSWTSDWSDYSTGCRGCLS